MARREQAVIILFDVDGTLILTGGAGRRAMRRAFGELHGDVSFLEQVDLRGRTDQSILSEACRSVNVEPDAAALARIVDLYLGYLEEEVGRSDGYRVMPGVHALLDALEPMDAMALGVGTGNVQRAAAIKLARGGLSSRLAFGGFGCDAAERPSLLTRGFERGADKLGLPLDECVRVVIGDTPLDVEAAHAVGASSIAVRTGGCSQAELLQAGASLVVDDLRDPAVFGLLRTR